MMDMGSVTSIVSVALASLLALFGGFRYVTAQVESIRREIASVERNGQLYADKIGETESKQRHSNNNQIQVIVAKLETDIRTLQRDSVRQDQMEALERRILNGVAKLEGKVDRLADVTNEMIAMKQSLVHITGRLDKILDKDRLT